MKHHLISKLQDNLKDCEFSMTNGSITHFVYPCEGCGEIMYHLYEDDDLILSIELDNIESLDIARIMWNRKSGLQPMTKRNFVDFLIYLHEVSVQEKANLN